MEVYKPIVTKAKVCGHPWHVFGAANCPLCKRNARIEKDGVTQ